MPTSIPSRPAPSLADFGCERRQASRSLVGIGLAACLIVSLAFGYAALFGRVSAPSHAASSDAAFAPLLSP